MLKKMHTLVTLRKHETDRKRGLFLKHEDAFKAYNLNRAVEKVCTDRASVHWCQGFFFHTANIKHLANSFTLKVCSFVYAVYLFLPLVPLLLAFARTAAHKLVQLVMAVRDLSSNKTFATLHTNRSCRRAAERGS